MNPRRSIPARLVRATAWTLAVVAFACSFSPRQDSRQLVDHAARRLLADPDFGAYLR